MKEIAKDVPGDVAWDLIGLAPGGDEVSFFGRRIVRKLEGKPVWNNRTGNENIITQGVELLVGGIESITNAYQSFEKGDNAKGVEHLTRGLNDIADATARGVGLPWGGPVGQLLIEPLLYALNQPTDKELQNWAWRLGDAKLTERERRNIQDKLKDYGITKREQIIELRNAKRVRDIVQGLQPKPPTLRPGDRQILEDQRALKGY